MNTATTSPARPSGLLAIAGLAFALTATAQDRPQRDDPQRPRDGAPPRGEFQQRQPAQPRDGFRPEGQPRDGFQGQPREGFRPGQPGQGGPGNFPNPMADLNEDQRETVREIMNSIFQDNREAMETLMTARRELGEMFSAPKLDEKALREKVVAIAKLDADMLVARAKAFARVRDKLGPEVAERIKPMFMPGMGGMGGPGMGGPRPGGPGGPGGDFQRPQGNPGQPPRDGDLRRPRGDGQPGDPQRPRGGDGVNERRPGGNNPPPRDNEPRRPAPANP
jgi:Spy/CpxP family protein refolding chaperone